MKTLKYLRQPHIGNYIGAWLASVLTFGFLGFALVIPLSLFINLITWPFCIFFKISHDFDTCTKDDALEYILLSLFVISSFATSFYIFHKIDKWDKENWPKYEIPLTKDY